MKWTDVIAEFAEGDKKYSWRRFRRASWPAEWYIVNYDHETDQTTLYLYKCSKKVIFYANYDDVVANDWEKYIL